MRWIDDVTFEMDGVKITLDYEHGGSRRRSEAADFTMMKTRGFLDYYAQHRDEDFKRILEVGVYQGGSFVFLDKLFKPDRLSAIELSDQPISALDAYVEKNQPRTRMHYATSQGDTERVAEIIEQDFGGVLDLVVDDASHFYELTKATFKTAFPRLRPGGLYIIEDWSWSFQQGFQAPDHPLGEHELAREFDHRRDGRHGAGRDDRRYRRVTPDDEDTPVASPGWWTSPRGQRSPRTFLDCTLVRIRATFG